jgi:hypothetical protein
LLRYEIDFCRIIFPSGGTVTWKTGFYNLAKHTSSKTFIVGLDYSKKEVVVDSVFDVSKMTFEEAAHHSIAKLKKYGPGPICLFMRIICGYGCMTYDVPKQELFMYRTVLCVVLAFVLYYTDWRR